MKILIIIPPLIVTLASVEFSGNFSLGISAFPTSVKIAKGCIVALFFSIISPVFVPASVVPFSFRSSFSLAFLFSFPLVSSFSSFPLSSINSGSTVVHSGDEISVLDGSSVDAIVESVNVFVEHVVQESVTESASLVEVDSNTVVNSVLLDNCRMRIK